MRPHRRSLSKGLRRTGSIAVYTAVALCAALVAACSSGGSNASPSTSPSTASSSSAPSSGSTSSTSSSSTTAGVAGVIIPNNKLNSTVESILGPIKTATGSTTRGINGKTITIEGIGDVTANGVTQMPGLCDGAAARFARANRDGGVNGYKINYIGCHDTGSVPATASQLVQQAIEQNNVFAVIPFTSAVEPSNQFEQSHTLAFGFGTNPNVYCGWNDNQFAFSVAMAEGCQNALPNESIFSSVGLEAYVKGAHVNPHTIKLAIIGNQIPIDIVSVKSEAAIAKSLGMTVVYTSNAIPGPTSPAPSDYTPYAQAIINSGATLLFDIAGTFNEYLGLSQALKANAYKGQQVQFVITDNSTLSLAPIAAAFDGSYALTAQIGSAVFPSASSAQVAADLKAIGSDASAEALGTLTSYGAADMFLAALSHITGQVTSEKIANFINSGWTYPGLGNSVCPAIFPAGHVAASNCGAVVRVSAAAKNVTPVIDLTPNLGQNYLIKLSG
jgi:branched-chain amino acid transport system substrate-binding protein